MSGMRVLVVGLNVRHLLRRRLRTFLTLSGIAAGVALAFSIGVINTTLFTSFRSSVRDLAGSAELEVAATDQNGMPLSVLEEVQEVPGVDRAVPILRATTSLKGSGGRERALVLGVRLDAALLFPDASPLTRTNVDGGLGPGTILLAERVADSIDAQPGDQILVAAPGGLTPVVVGGSVDSSALQLLNGGDVAIMLLPDAQELFDRPDTIDSVYVIADPAVPLGTVEGDLEAAVGERAIVGPPGTRAEGLERVFGGLGTLLSLAGTVSLFVSLFVVYNTMSMSLAERRREISMAMTLGARRKDLFVAILGEALILGAVASAMGIGFGLLLARVLISQAEVGFRFIISGTGPVVVRPGQLVLAIVSGLAVSVVGAYLPARKILTVSPIEALRPEASYEWSRAHTDRSSSRLLSVLSVVGIGIALGLFALHSVWTTRWIPTLGMVFGLAGVTFLLPRVVPRAIDILRPWSLRVFGTTGRLSTDALERNPGRTTFTVAALVLTLGVALGVGSALASYEGRVESVANTLSGADFYVTSNSYTGITSDQPLPGELRSDLEAVDGVGYVYPLRFVLLNIGEEQGLLYAIPVAEALEEGATTSLSGFADDPNAFLDGLERGDVAISRLTSERHDVSVGEKLALPTPDGERSFQVASIFEDLVSFDSVYMDYEVYVDIYGDEKVDEFGILLDEGADPSVVERALDGVVDDTQVAATVFEKEELVGRILEVVQGTFSLGRGIQLAALVVAALTIANTMFTAVFERRWQMGLERALGMSGRQLGRSVLVEAASIGVIGGIGGAILGTASGFLMTKSMEAQFSWSIPFQVPVVMIGLAIVGGIAVAAAAGIVPSRMAARAQIIECLRYE